MADPLPPVPSRAQIEELVEEVIAAGGRSAARIAVFSWHGRRWVFKDYSRSGPLFRFFIARRFIRREVRCFRRLEGLAGIPRTLGQVDRVSHVLEYLAGQPLGRRRMPPDPAAFFAALEGLLEEIHRRGVVHLDLRQRRNIVVRPDGTPGLIDFEQALCTGRGPLGRLLLRFGRWVDRSSSLKYRVRYAPRSVSSEELRSFHRFERIRRLWFLSPHRRRESNGRQP